MGEIHVWKAFSFNTKELFIDSGVNRGCGISSDQKNKVFTPSRRVVAEIAASYLGAIPSDITFDISKEGKPYIRGAADLHFNLSHCGKDLAVVFASEEVGFDMEQKGRQADFVKLAKRFFTAAEAIEVEKNGGALFLQQWTAKEAMLKLLGRGLQGGLASAVVVSDGCGVVCGESVRLHELVWSAHHAHVAMRGAIEVVREFEFMEHLQAGC